MMKNVKKVLAAVLVISICFAGPAMAEMVSDAESDMMTDVIVSAEVFDPVMEETEVQAGEVPADETAVDEIIAGDVLIDEVTADEVLTDDITVDDITSADVPDPVVTDESAQPEIFPEELLVFEEVIESESVVVSEEIMDLPQAEEEPAAVPVEDVTDLYVPAADNEQPASAELPAASDNSLSTPEVQPAQELQELLIEEIVTEEESAEDLEDLNVTDNSPLVVGMRSEAVLSFQQALLQKGFPINPDGYYGYETALIVKIFQVYNALPITGIGDEATKNAVFGDGTGYYTFGRGTYSKAVYGLQVLLSELGYLTAPIDGDYGYYTQVAVVTYQKYNGLIADGTVGMQTMRSILSTPVAASGVQGVFNQELKKGDTGTDVAKIQYRLEQLGYLQSVIDGEYGTVTEKAVKVFQMFHGLTVTGVADRTTITYLNNPNARMIGSLQYASEGYAVSVLQTALKSLGYFQDEVDGYYGAYTKSAVAVFQKTNGIVMDGVAGPETLSKLFVNPLPYDPSVIVSYSEAETAAASILNQIGWGSLYYVYEWVVSVPYHHLFTGFTVTESALYTIYHGYGDCLGKAALFCVLARVMGYDCQVIWGSVPLSGGEYADHAWVEFYYNGVTYICDPEFEYEGGRNGYMIHYGQSGTWKYIYGFILPY